MDIHDYSFDLPEELIGQEAIEPRDSCKLLVVNRTDNSLVHKTFRDLIDILDQNCVLVLNDTKVFPARLFGEKTTGGKVEVLLLKQISQNTYECIVRGKLRDEQKVIFDQDLFGVIHHSELNRHPDRSGGISHPHTTIQISFNLSGPNLLGKLDELGKTPLPPYIHSHSDEQELRQQYQTVYARERGSAAAPTAGLHFTEDLMDKLIKKGVQVEKVTLHVGLGTFKPVTEAQIASRTLHSESFWLAKEVTDRLNEAKKQNKKIIAVGTTTCRVLETQSDDSGNIAPGEGETNIFIQPGYKYKFVEGLITNFHLPETSLLMLVTALVSFPNSPTKFSNFQDSLIGKAYREAIDKKYKFFSFGDAMLII